jgi:hypothetical protein
VSDADPLAVRYTFLKSLPWDAVVALNQAVCSKAAGVAHGFNRETITQMQTKWEAARHQDMTLVELLDFLHLCHKTAPFLNFNGNVFGEVARQIVAVSLLGMPGPRITAATSLAAHCVAGVVDKQQALSGIRSLLVAELLQPGDHVTTLKSSNRGVVTRVLPDGRVAWLPAGRKVELLAAPETLLKAKPRKFVDG